MKFRLVLRLIGATLLVGTTASALDFLGALSAGGGTSSNGNYSVVDCVGVIVGSATSATGGYAVQNGFTPQVDAASTVCQYIVFPTSVTVDEGGTNVSVSVTTTGACPWVVLNPCASWIGTNPSGTNGSSAVILTIAPNASGARTCTVTIASQSITVVQSGLSCSYALSSSTTNLSSSGGTGNVVVATATSCAWTALSDSLWLHTSSTGNRTGLVEYSVDDNPDATQRDGTITVQGQVFVIHQYGTGGPWPPESGVTNAALQVGDLFLVGADGVAHFIGNSGGASGGTTAYQWDFGDQTTSTDPNPTHIYAATNCGPYLVSVRIISGQAVVTNRLIVTVPCELLVTNVQMKLNFAVGGKDAMSLRAFPALPDGFIVSNQVLVLNLGDALIQFTLDPKGKGVGAAGTCKLTRGRTGIWTLAVNLRNGNWRSVWDTYGLENATIPKPGAPVTVPVMLVIGEEGFVTDKALRYVAKENKTGTARDK